MAQPFGIFRVRLLRDHHVAPKQGFERAQDVPAAAAGTEEQNGHLAPS
jgi:hypothetical protein